MKKKIFTFTLLVAFFVTYLSLPAGAEPINWQLQFNEDGTVEEKVIFTEGELDFSKELWDCSEKDGECTISRILSAWNDYNSVSDRLPLVLKLEDKYVYQNLSLVTPKGHEQSQLLPEDKEINLTISFPGFINSSVENKKDAGQAYWHFNSAKELYELQPGLFVQAVIIDGFNMAVFVLGIGFIILLFFFARSVHKVKKIIAEEYSLDDPVEDE